MISRKMVPQKTTDQTSLTTNLHSSQITLQRLADPKRFNEILATVPVKLEQVIQCPPISALVHAGAIKSSIEAVLAIEITKASQMLTVGGNLRQGQSLEIAQQLIAQYPHESLEDFCYCLRQGVKGRYNDPGKLFRFDSVVINEWFVKYLDEKAIAAEEALMKEKESLYERTKRTDSDWLQLLTEAVQQSEEVKTTPQSKVFMQKVMDLTEKEIEEEGKATPKKQGYPSTSLSEIRKRELHIQYIRENYDSRTADPLPTWLPENEWLKNQK
jgi:hypothetical protein